mgnify:CR=1 FL=1
MTQCWPAASASAHRRSADGGHRVALPAWPAAEPSRALLRCRCSGSGLPIHRALPRRALCLPAGTAPRAPSTAWMGSTVASCCGCTSQTWRASLAALWRRSASTCRWGRGAALWLACPVLCWRCAAGAVGALCCRCVPRCTPCSVQGVGCACVSTGPNLRPHVLTPHTPCLPACSACWTRAAASESFGGSWSRRARRSWRASLLRRCSRCVRWRGSLEALLGPRKLPAAGMHVPGQLPWFGAACTICLRRRQQGCRRLLPPSRPPASLASRAL